MSLYKLFEVLKIIHINIYLGKDNIFQIYINSYFFSNKYHNEYYKFFRNHKLLYEHTDLHIIKYLKLNSYFHYKIKFYFLKDNNLNYIGIILIYIILKI